MRSPVLVDPSPFALVAAIECGFATFAADCARLQRDHFTAWHDGAAYSGGWMVFPLVMRITPVPPMYDLVRNRRLCPGSSRLLAQHPRILLAAFSRLLPGCLIRPHGDRPRAGVLRFQLGLSGDAGAVSWFGSEEVCVPRGRVIVFDQSMEHSARNLGAVPRDVLLVDLALDADEVRAVVAARGAVHLGPTATTAS